MDKSQKMWCYVSQANKVVLDIEVDPKENGQQCIDQVCRRLGIVEQDYFGLHYRGNRGESLWLNLRNQMDRQLIGTPPFRLQLRVKFFAQPHYLLQQTTRYQFYLQAKADLESQKLVPDLEQTTDIVALMAQADHGDYDSRSYQLNLYSTLLCGIADPSPALIQGIAAAHQTLVGMPKEAAMYKLLKVVSGLPNYGVEYHEARNSVGEHVNVGIGPEGVIMYTGSMEQIEKVEYQRITKAVHTRKNCALSVMNDNGLETEVILKLITSRAANAMYRCITEMNSFFRCNTVDNEVSTQFSRDLKGIVASIFNENTTLGRDYVFDIKRTSREAYDHARRTLYNPAEMVCRQTPAQTDGDGVCDNQQGGDSKCKVLEEKLERIEESFLCCVCRDANISTALCPCGHVTCCRSCADKLTECPMCRQEIKLIQRIFLPTVNIPSGVTSIPNSASEEHLHDSELELMDTGQRGHDTEMMDTV